MGRKFEAQVSASPPRSYCPHTVRAVQCAGGQRHGQENHTAHVDDERRTRVDRVVEDAHLGSHRRLASPPASYNSPSGDWGSKATRRGTDVMSYLSRIATFIAVVVLVFGSMVVLQKMLGVIAYAP